jgi:hypothetical protein
LRVLRGLFGRGISILYRFVKISSIIDALLKTFDGSFYKQPGKNLLGDHLGHEEFFKGNDLFGVKRDYHGGLWSKIADFTYLSSTEACFRCRRFPIEIIRPDEYMKIKFKHFG